MRQLTTASGAVNLAQSFDPTGSPYQRAGAEVTTYGFAGEQADANGLITLRARFYAPDMGRFLNTDPSRAELNPYQYSYSNPITHGDPSGLCGGDINIFGKVNQTKTDQCLVLVEALETAYGITIYWPARNGLPTGMPNDVSCLCEAPASVCTDDVPVWPTDWEVHDPYNSQFKSWRLKEILSLAMALTMYQNEMGFNATHTVFEGVLFARADKTPTGGATLLTSTLASYWHTGYGGFGQPTVMYFDTGASQDFGLQTWTFTHELAHRLDWFVLDQGFADVTRADFTEEFWDGSDVNPGTGPTRYARDLNSRVNEDIAESVTVYL